MTEYYNKTELFMEPKTKQYGNHMIMTNVHKPSKTKYISIDTKFRDDYDYMQPANFQIVLPEKVNDVHTLRVTSIEVPMSFYNISANLGNNYFKVVNGSNTVMIIIDDNNYTATSLATQITHKLSLSQYSSDLTVTLSANTRTVVSTSTNVSLVFDVDVAGNSDKFNFKQKLGWLLGFSKPTYAVVTSSSTTAECTLDMYGSRYLYLAIDEFNKGNQNSFVTPLSSSLINKNIIARITLDMATYSYGTILPATYYNGLLTTDTRSYTGKIDLQKLNVQLLNESGIPIMLNGQDFSFCLEASCE
jgi:hypothetical protein